MKIIKQGHDENRMQAVCQNCEAILEITAADIHHEETLESTWGRYFYECPCCGATRYLKPYEMTRGVKINLHRK